MACLTDRLANGCGADAGSLRPSVYGDACDWPMPDSHDHRPRLAAIDVGSNSIRLIVAEVEDDGSYRVLDDERETTRLAAGLSQTGHLSPEAVAKSIEAISRMKAIAD